MKKFKKIFIVCLTLGFLGLIVLMGINFYVIMNTEQNIVTLEDLKENSADYILVLGAGLKTDGTPSPMLQERLDKGIELYKEGVSSKLIMSGDHEKEDHDEVNAMKDYVTAKGVPSEAIYMDHSGLSTYDSIYRTKEVFDASNIIIVTQKYHLYRSIHIAKKLGLEAFGVDAQETTYRGQTHREIREVLARIKDFFKSSLKPTSTYIDDAIPASVDGNYTNDKKYIIIKNFKKDDNFEIYMSKKGIVDKIESIISDYEFTKETCDGMDEYSLTFSEGKEYGIEVYSSNIHITEKNKEIKLNEEDSKYMMELIGID